MANITTKFNCNSGNKDYIEVLDNGEDISFQIRTFDNEFIGSILLDIPTAIKFHKTLRTEINKVKNGLNEEENNG